MDAAEVAKVGGEVIGPNPQRNVANLHREKVDSPKDSLSARCSAASPASAVTSAP